MHTIQTNNPTNHNVYNLEHVQHLVMNRLHNLRTMHTDRIPILRHINDQYWFTSTSGSWIGGFWLSVNFLLDVIDGHNIISEDTKSIAYSIASRYEVDSIHMSMVGAYGFSFCCNYTDTPIAVYFQDELEAFKIGIADKYHFYFGCFTLGTALGGKIIGKDTISVDSLHAILILLGNDTRYQKMAKNHIDLYLKYSNVYSEVPGILAHKGGQWVPKDTDKFWDRGHAWLILALAEAENLWGEKYNAILIEQLELWFSEDFNAKRDRLSRDTSADLMVILTALNVSSVDFNSSLLKKVKTRFWSILNDTKISEVTKDQLIYTGCLINGKNTETIWGYFFIINIVLKLKAIIQDIY